MEITDKDNKALIRSNFYTFIQLLDSEGTYITGVAVAANTDAANIQVMFPGCTIQSDGESGISAKLPKVKAL